jgi:deoxyribose-phosphate aldolase
VNPVHVAHAVKRIASVAARSARQPAVVSVAGFPLGASRSDVKADEAKRAMDDGAAEVDTVVFLGALKSGDVRAARVDIEAVARAVHGRRPAGLLKVILETAALTRDEILAGCRCCAEGEADFVKTSTGMHAAGGATVEVVRLLHQHAAPIGVKAAGGIRTAKDALAMIDAGASRLGTSSGVAIVAEQVRALAACCDGE